MTPSTVKHPVEKIASGDNLDDFPSQPSFKIIWEGLGRSLFPLENLLGKQWPSFRKLYNFLKGNKTITLCIITCLCALDLIPFSKPALAVDNLKEISLESLFKEHVDSVVLIGALYKKKNRLGTGFIVSESGLIVTNAHLIKPSWKIIVKLHNSEVLRQAQLLSLDKKKDIAILKINARHLKPVRLGNSNKVQIGQRVVSIGNPLGLENTISDGLISSWRLISEGFKMLQISVPLSEGSSGGPLFNLDGEVIGITSFSNTKGQNLNFALPVNDLKPMLAKWIFRSEKTKLRISKSQLFIPPQNKFLKKSHSLMPGEDVYIIQPQDTLHKLARRFNTTVSDLMELNHLSDSKIIIGQKIKIPNSGPQSTNR